MKAVFNLFSGNSREQQRSAERSREAQRTAERGQQAVGRLGMLWEAMGSSRKPWESLGSSGRLRESLGYLLKAFLKKQTRVSIEDLLFISLLRYLSKVLGNGMKNVT